MKLIRPLYCRTYTDIIVLPSSSSSTKTIWCSASAGDAKYISSLCTHRNNTTK